MSSKRKRDSSDPNSASPSSKITKTEEVTRSGRVRKRPAKFSEPDGEDDEPVSGPPKPAQVAMTIKSPVKVKTEPTLPAVQAALQSPVAVRMTAKSPKAVPMPVTPVQVEVKADLSTSPDSADDLGKSGGRRGRMRKKSAKVLEMEEFEEAERKNLKKPGSAEAAKKSTPEAAPAIAPPVQEILPPKKAYKASATVPPLVTAALAAKIASNTPAMALKIKDMPATPSVQVKTEPASPVKAKSSSQSSPKGGASAIRLDQATEQDKGSVIKLLLSSPTQSSTPSLSTKAVAGTSPPTEKLRAFTKKKSKGKEKAEASANLVETSATDLPNLKLALSLPSSSPPSTNLLVNTSLIKQEIPVSPEGQQALKLKFVLTPDGVSATQPVLQSTQIKTEPIKMEPLSPIREKTTTKHKKSKKVKDTGAEQEIQFSPTQMVTPSVIHVPSTSGLDTSDHHLPPKKKKSAKIKIEKEIKIEPEKPLMDEEFGLDLSTLGEAGDESLMNMDDNDGLMMSEEDLDQVKPVVKSPKKKKAKTKGIGKKGTIQLGDIPHNPESDLVMDFERMKHDERKKKKQQKVVPAPEPEVVPVSGKKKRAPTAYMMWCSANRQKVVKDNPGIDFSTISKTLGEMWSGLTDKDKLMWKRKAKKAAGKGSTLIKTGKVPALAAAKQQAQAQPVPIRHGGHHPSAQKASAAITAAMLTKAAKQAVEEIPAKGFGADPVDVAAHLKIVGESLSIIGMRLQEHRGLIAVQGSLSVLLDSMLCAMAPLMCLTNQLEELNGCSHQTHMKTLDNIAYIMPGL